MKKTKRLFLIDGMAIIYRAYFAMIKNPLITKDGQHTSAIYGFINSILKIINDESPDYLVVVLDSKEKTFRHDLFTEYKEYFDPKVLREAVRSVKARIRLGDSVMQLDDIIDQLEKRYTI